MPLTIPLTDSEIDTIRYACKSKKDITLDIRSRQLTLSKTNLIPIRQAINSTLQKKLAVKTKNGEHLEIIYNATRIIGKIDGVAGQLGQTIEEEEEKPELNEDWFNEAEKVNPISADPPMLYDITEEPESDNNNGGDE